MTYNPMKPDAGPSPAVDAPTIQTNFAQFASIFSSTAGGIIYNHTPLNNPNAGDHESVILTLQNADPGVTNNYDALYSKNGFSQAGTQPQLYVQLPQYLPTEQDPLPNANFGIQLTYNSVNTSGTTTMIGPQTYVTYYSFLPRGLISSTDTGGVYLIYFGTDTGTSIGNAAINDTITLVPTPSQLIIAYAVSTNFRASGQPVPPAYNASTTLLNNSQFTINSSGNSSGAPSTAYKFFWMAIAKA